MLRSLITAFQMYSKIPMPKIEWKDENRRFSLAFFPFIGIIIGALLVIWRVICNKLLIGQCLFSAVSVALPILISGGIHFDGFCDVTDALHSYGDKNKKNEIMKDPHIGAFALIYSCIYFILQFGFFTQIAAVTDTLLTAVGFVLSRILSSFSVIFFKTAKESSSLKYFKLPLDKMVTITLETVLLILCLAVLFIISPIAASLIVGILSVHILSFKRSCIKYFGGITGDLCGWLLQTIELLILAAVVISSRIIEVFL